MKERLYIACVIAVVMFGMLCNVSDSEPQWRIGEYAQDWIHVPVFFLLLILVANGKLPRFGNSPRKTSKVWKSALLCIAVAALIELIQPWTGRDRSWVDLVLGCTGVCVGVAVVRRRTALAIVIGVVTLVPFGLLAYDAYRAESTFPVLAAFYDPLELGRWEIDGCNVGLVGGRAQVTTVGEGEYPGLFLEHGPSDWDGMRNLRVELDNAGKSSLALWIRVDDARGEEGYGQRFQKKLALAPGTQKICLSREEIVQTPDGRPLDLTDIHRIGFFFESGEEGQVILIDNLALETE